MNYFIEAVITPVIIKHVTATIERIDNLGRPQTPWPLVQPLPSLVPNPTRNPAEAKPSTPGSPTITAGESKAFPAA